MDIQYLLWKMREFHPVMLVFGGVNVPQRSPEMEVREARGGAEAAEEAAAPSTGQPGGFNGIKGVVWIEGYILKNRKGRLITEISSKFPEQFISIKSDMIN